MIRLTDENFDQEVLKADLPVFVDFYSDWCGPCKMAEPVIKELAREYEGKVKFAKLNVDEGQETAANYKVMSIPTAIVFEDGEEVRRLVGFRGKVGYKKLIERILG